MELTKQPVTEMDYWKLIKVLADIIFYNNYDLTHGNVDGNHKMKVINQRDEAIELQEKIVVELSEKFGVIRSIYYPVVKPGETLPPAPEGKIYYYDWYKKRKLDFYTEEYEKIICSACPLSNGLDEMMNLSGVIPCGATRGSIYHLRVPYQCGMIGTWSKEELYFEIKKKAGEMAEMALLKFQKKKEELEKKFNETKMQE